MPRPSPSIARKLTTLNTLVSAAAVLLACLAFGAYDRATFTAELERNLSIQAQIVGANSVTALLFNDPHTAEGTLEALRAAPNIVSADIYGLDDRLFAGYRRDDASQAPTLMAIPTPTAEVRRTDNEQIGLARRIVFQGKELGRVSIRSDLRALNTRRTQFITMGAAVLTAALVVTLLMSWISQRAISRPIVELAGIARRVSTDKDYAVRATTSAHTREGDVLVEAFNEMLTEIQRRDHSLGEAQEQLEDRVRQRTAELDAANKELEAFSYSVSHDLRAPLRHVAGFAGLLEAHASQQLDGQGRRYLGTIVTAATKMGALIDDLLLFSRMGRSVLTRRRLSLNDLVREARQEVLSHTDVASREIEWELSSLPDVEGDHSMLRQVMVNLLSNAVKYTSSQAAARIEVGTQRDLPGEVTVFVRDNGVGFNQQFAHKLFGVFQRLHSADEFEGTGIGLANVKRIVERHGGRVWAESELGRGATFYFSLPMVEPRL